MTRRNAARQIGSVLLLASLAVAPVARAHMEVKPKRAPAGERVTLTFDVENESDSAGTRKIDMKLPEGITSVSPRSVRGWKVRLRRSGAVIERLILTAPQGREIPAGNTHGKFTFSVLSPNQPDTRIAFKAVQTYEDGKIQRWIGPPSSEEPAPTLRLTVGKAAEERPTQTERPDGSPPGGTDAADVDDGDDGGSGAVIAIVAAIAVAAAVAAGVFWSRRRRAR